jgi:uncharacterized protein (TIGR02145 family)
MQYANEEGSQGICPDGWHIPSSRDFVEPFIYCDNYWPYLVSYQDSLWGDDVLYKYYLNLSGFSALPAGGKWEGDDAFHSMNEFAGFWSSSESDDTNIFGFGLPPIQELEGQLAHKQAGLSVRCIKDE